MRHSALQTLAQTQPDLAGQFDAGWDVSVRAWSEAVWSPPERAGFEAAFRRALVAELEPRVGTGADELVAAIERSGAVVTSHHVCPTNGPTFGAIDFIASAGQPGPILVLAWSGVPMSNSAVSSALCFSESEFDQLLTQGSAELKQQRSAARDRARDGVTERRITLVPGALRDALVYGCPIPDRLLQVLSSATPALRARIGDPLPGEDYAAWALRVNEGLERAVLGRDNLWYLDLNRVAARYLADVCTIPSHPLARLMRADPDGPLSQLSDQSWFYERRPGKRERVSTHARCPEDWMEGLSSGRLCPGLVPVFGALRLLSRVRLLGGFRQIAYLEEISRVWLEAGVADRDLGVPGRLITGRLTTRDGRAIHPLDVAMGTVDRGALPSVEAPMSRLWEPLLPRVGG